MRTRDDKTPPCPLYRFFSVSGRIGSHLRTWELRSIKSAASIGPQNRAQYNLDITKGQGTDKIRLLLRGFVISKFFFRVERCPKFILFKFKRFFFIYFTITGAKNIVRFTEDFLMSRSHCAICQTLLRFFSIRKSCSHAHF